jgi:hypothetical protein
MRLEALLGTFEYLQIEYLSERRPGLPTPKSDHCYYCYNMNIKAVTRLTPTWIRERDLQRRCSGEHWLRLSIYAGTREPDKKSMEVEFYWLKHRPRSEYTSLVETPDRLPIWTWRHEIL